MTPIRDWIASLWRRKSSPSPNGKVAPEVPAPVVDAVLARAHAALEAHAAREAAIADDKAARERRRIVFEERRAASSQELSQSTMNLQLAHGKATPPERPSAS